MINKDYGSDFHLCLVDKFLQRETKYYFSDKKLFSLFFSGRSALYSILEKGIHELGWKKVYFPSYYCHEIVQFLKNLSIEIIYYEYNPFVDKEDKNIEAEDHQHNVIVNVSFFGLSKLNLNNYKNVAVIDDLTHDVLAYNESMADYCFGSLRKQFPVPCGGFCYSPKNNTLPVAKKDLKSDEIAFQKISAMFLKREYLEGRLAKKEIYREQFMEAETRFGEDYTNSEMPQIAQTILKGLNIDNILTAKIENLSLAYSLLKSNKEVVYNISLRNEKALGLLVKVNSFENREKLKSLLFTKNIFPAILWPHQKETRDIETEKTMLFLHMDFRYDAEDIKYICGILNQYFING